LTDTLQVLKGTGARPRITFYSSGVPSDLDTGVPTVVVTRPDATTIASGTVTKVTGTTGTYEFTLAPQANETLLTVTWTGVIGGVTETLTTWVEVVGGFLFTLAELRAWPVAGSTPFTDSTRYPDSTLQQTRQTVTHEFEGICGWSFIPRFARETLDGTATSQLLVSHLLVQRVLSAVVDGVALDATALADLTPTRWGAILRRTLGWWPATTVGNVTVEYVHGWARVPGAIHDAALTVAAAKLAPAGLGSTASSYTTPGGDTYTYDPAGRATAAGLQHYGIPKVDSVLNRTVFNAGTLAVA
jgi:hypothetical protein